MCLCLLLSLTGCSSAPVVAPSHAVEVTHYEAPVQAEANTRQVSHCPLRAGSTFGDLAHAYACSDGEITLANCRLDRAGARPLSDDCKALLEAADAAPPPR